MEIKNYFAMLKGRSIVGKMVLKGRKLAPCNKPNNELLKSRSNVASDSELLANLVTRDLTVDTKSVVN